MPTGDATSASPNVSVAAPRSRARSGSAMDVALAQIGAAFDEAAAINRFKIRVERYIRLGPRHVAMRARTARAPSCCTA